MRKVNVLVVSRLGLGREFFDEIAAVDPRVSVKDGLEQFLSELGSKGRSGYLIDLMRRDAMAEKVGGGHPYQTGEDFDALLREAAVIFGLAFPDNLYSRAPNLKWIHLLSAGLDDVDAALLGEGVMITNNSGALSLPIAEHALGLIFMLAKGAPRLFEDKQKRHWERFYTLDIAEKTLGVIGLGHIGKEVARLAKGVGMRVVATRRSATKRETSVEDVDQLLPPWELLELLRQSDFVVLTVPQTVETENLIRERELRAMKPGAFLINVCRGGVIDEPVLIKALREGWIAGAGLDEQAKEPLPPESELWDLSNVIISPHKGAWTENRSKRYAKLFCDNLRRYLAGQELINLIVDRKRGY